MSKFYLKCCFYGKSYKAQREFCLGVFDDCHEAYEYLFSLLSHKEKTLFFGKNKNEPKLLIQLEERGETESGMDIKLMLKNRRKELGLTMKHLSEMVKVSESTISRWESGKISNMTRENISMLAKALKVNPSEIMGWENEYPCIVKNEFWVSNPNYESPVTYDPADAFDDCEAKNYEQVDNMNLAEVFGFKPNEKFMQRFLDLCRSECEDFISSGNSKVECLWNQNVNEHIALMRELYRELPEKPYWLTPENIDDYEKEMRCFSVPVLVDIDTKVYQVKPTGIKELIIDSISVMNDRSTIYRARLAEPKETDKELYCYLSYDDFGKTWFLHNPQEEKK